MKDLQYYVKRIFGRGKEPDVPDWVMVSAKLLFLSAIVGLATGMVAALFYVVLNSALDTVFDLTNFHPPQPGDIGHSLNVGAGRRWWILMFLPAIGGLLVGLITTYLAPEVEGGGTEAAIDAFHRFGAKIRARVIVLKAIAAMFTIAGGGSAGREGPIAHIASAIGSNIAKLFKLSPKERRMLLIAGFAGGISATFRAPLGGAIYAVEVLYREDFESDGIISSIISAVVAYITFNAILGSGELFKTPTFQPITPYEIIGYTILIIVTTLAGMGYIKLYFAIDNLFKTRINVPAWLKPAIGGMIVGLIGLAVPQTMFIGYGYIQQAINAGHFLVSESGFATISVWTILLIVAAKMIATPFTVASGGAGGLFAPSMVIGGMLGAAVGHLLYFISPSLVASPAAYVLVGMGSFFAGIAKVPLASLIMVSEMSRNYSLLAPMMLVGIVVYLFNRKLTIYKQQTFSRVDSPAHRYELISDLLARIKVGRAYQALDEIPYVNEATPFSDVVRALSDADLVALPVVNSDGDVVGIVSLEYIRSVLFEHSVDFLLIAKDVAQKVKFITPDDSLQKAMEYIISTSAPALFVMPNSNTRRHCDIIGIITHAQIISAYRKELDESRSLEYGE